MLPRGGADFWVLDGKAGELLRLDASSESFDTSIDLIELETGFRLSDDDTGGEKNARLIGQLTRTGKYLLRVQCYGHGGGGAYQLRRVSIPARSIAMNARATGTLVADEPGIWSFTGKAGQTILLSIRSQAFDSEVQLNGPDGTLIVEDDDGGDGTNSLRSVRLPKDGTYTIWVTGKGGKGDYTLRLMDAD
ncbi:MAG: PPC domain-containing protein [Armatimonas sp.]